MARLAVVYLCFLSALAADDWRMAFHDVQHSGRTSEILTTPLTLAWTWKDTASYDNDPRWHPQVLPWLPIYYQGRFYIQGGLNANRLFAIDPATGQTIWESDTPGYTASGTYLFQYSNYPAALQGRILNAATDYTISVDAATGGDQHKIYNTNGGWPSGGVALWNNYAIYQFVETDNGAEDLHFVYDPTNLGQYGPYILPKASDGLYTDYAFRVPAADDNVIYANRMGKLVAWDPPSTHELWTWGSRNFGASPAVWNHIVFFYASASGVLAAIPTTTTPTASGSLNGVPLLWTARIAGAYSPIASDGVVYVGSSDRNFYALDAITGAVKWKIAAGAPFTALQIPAISGSLIYVPGADGVLRALNKATGEEVWRYTGKAAFGPVVIAGGYLVVSDSAFNVYGFTADKAATLPAVTRVSPSRVTNAAATALSISGSGLTGASAVQIDDGARTPLSGIKVTADGAVTATLPAGESPGRYRLSVTGAAGTSVDGPVIEVAPNGSFFRGFLGTAEGTYDHGTDHLVQRHLARMPDGTLIAGYSGRTTGGDVRFTYHLSRDGGRTWTFPAQFPIPNVDFSVIYFGSFGIATGQGNQIHMMYVQWPGYKQTFAAYNYYPDGDMVDLAPKMPAFFTDTPPYAGPSVMEPGGRIWVAYALGDSVYASWSTDGGLNWTQSDKINQGKSSPPAMVLAGGTPVMVYTDGSSLAYSAWNGSQWSSPQTLPGPISGAADNLSLAATSDGRAHVAAANSSGLQYSVFNGTSWSAPTLLERGTSGPSITTDGTDLWCFYVTASNNIAYRRWRRDNGAWDAAVAVTNDGLTHSRPATLPLSPDGTIPVIWTVGSAIPYEIQSAVIPAQIAGAAALDTQAFAWPRMVTGKQTSITVSAVGGQAPYSYTWTPPGGVALNNTTATFSHAGTYHIPVTVRDAAGAVSVATVDVGVAAVPNGISVNAPVTPLITNSTYVFTATVSDQFGDAMALTPAPTWTLAAGSGKGFLDPSGAFVPIATGDFTVVATLPGGASASMKVTVVAPATPPVLSEISRRLVSDTSAVVEWTTDTACDSLVEYGLSGSYGAAVSDATLVTAHRIVLTGLLPDRIYHFRVRSKNASGQETVSVDRTLMTRRP
jgi:outer membrane protein assembly factor BamB